MPVVYITQPFPPLAPFHAFHLPVGDGHEIYVEQCGNPHGLPVVFLHGGPGGGCNPNHRRQFDPTKWHIILLDQRGCGRSHWAGKETGLATSTDLKGRLTANTTPHLVADLEAIRTHLGISQWVVNGNSWGSTLALAYATNHPARTLAVQVGAILLGTAPEKAWVTDPAGMAAFHPQEAAALRALLPSATSPAQVIDAAYAAMRDPANPRHAHAVVRAWSLFECRAADPTGDPAELTQILANTAWLLPHSLLECHYLKNNWFLSENQLLSTALTLKNIPVTLLQAIDDHVCPPGAALALHATLPGATLHLLSPGGHRANAAMDTARRTALATLHAQLS